MGSLQTFGSVGLLVGVVKDLLLDCLKLLLFETETWVCLSSDKGNSELVLHVIISPVVGEFKRCDTTGVLRSDSLGKFERCDVTGVVRSNSIGKFNGLLIGVESISACFVLSLSFWGVMTVLNNAGVLVLFLLVDLAKFMEESGVDAFVDPGVGAMNSFVVELDDMMVSERDFWVCNWLDFADRVNEMKVVKFSWLMRQNQGVTSWCVSEIEIWKSEAQANLR